MHEIVIIVAKYWIVIPVVASAIVWLRLSGARKKEYVLMIVFGAMITVLLAKVGSKLFDNPRPFVVGHFKPYFAHGADNGFPSDHTLLASLLAFTMLWFSKKVGVVLCAVALLIGLARIAAGVHHLIDIV